VFLFCREIFTKSSYRIPIENIIILAAALAFILAIIVFFVASTHYGEKFVCSWNATQVIQAKHAGKIEEE